MVDSDKFATKDRIDEMWTFLKDMKSSYAEFSNQLGDNARKTIEVGAQMEIEKKQWCIFSNDILWKLQEFEEGMLTKSHSDNIMKSVDDIKINL